MADELKVLGLGHVGIRVHDLERSLHFYELLGFERGAGPFDKEPVVILNHPCGLEINLVINAAKADEPNMLMDIPTKHPGYTHIALKVEDLESAMRRVQAAGYRISEGPVTFPTGMRAFFVRDPDRNVVEFDQLPSDA